MKREFSRTIAELRKRRGLSQRTVAAEMHISQALLSHYENGAREPGLDFLRRICVYYGVSADYLLGLSDREGLREDAVLESMLEELCSLSARIESALEGAGV